MRLLIVPVVASALAFSACAQPAPAVVAKPDLAAAEKAVRDADARWLKAAESRDAASEAAVFASDGVAYREHVDPLVGPAAFQAYQVKFRGENPSAKSTWSTDTITVAEGGDLAIQTGEYRISGLGPKGDRQDRGRFLTVWKKVNGEWKVAHDIGSTTMPEAAVEKKS
jgi:uncharacterized protein (TIGR02246 family)